VAEEIEAQGTGAQASGASIDPAAMSLALGGASRDKADAFLDDQRALIADQRHHLHEQFKQLKLGIFSQRVSIALKGLTAVIGLAVVIGLGVVIWNAAHADGLVVEALAVPPRFIEAGVGGEVMADDLMSKIGAIRDIAVAASLDESKGVSRDRDEDIKVEIPDTGVSLGQAWHYLRLWLGHERRVTGNLRAAGDGTIVLTVALEEEQGFTLSGNEGDLAKLEQQAAEHIFDQVDPLNYSLYLLVSDRPTEALAATERVTQSMRGPSERANVYSLLSYETLRATGDMALTAARIRLAMAIDPKAAAAHVEIIRDSIALGHDEEGLAEARAMPKLRAEDQPPLQSGRGFQLILYEAAQERDLKTGDFADALAQKCVDCSLSSQSLIWAEDAARAHDAAQSRSLIEQARAAGLAAVQATNEQIARARYFSDLPRGDGGAAAAAARAYAAAFKADTVASPKLTALEAETEAMPLLAEALAQSGDFDGAQAAIEATPLDCYDCLRERGRIAALKMNWPVASDWFARAVVAAPSVPFAYDDWGGMLLARGDADAAIAKFTLAAEKGPHFADPLELWGEALMARNRSDLALAKFTKAEKYAPKWGRLHLKWAEALGYAGHKDQARAQYQIASTLDLSASDKSEFARHVRN